MKLHLGKFRLVVRKKTTSEQVVGHCKRLPREGAAASSPSEFKECLGDTLSHTVYF